MKRSSGSRVEDDGARRAVPAGFYGRAAHLVASGLGPRVPGAPVAQKAQGTGEVVALLAQPVGEARGPLGVRFGDDQELPLQVLEALREDVGGDAGQGLDQVVEAPGALQQGFDEQHRPPVAHPGHRRGQRRHGRFAHALIVIRPSGALRGASGPPLLPGMARHGNL